MIRFLAQAALTLIGNALGLIAAALVLPDFQISGFGFTVSIVFFTVAQIVLAPFVLKLAIKLQRLLDSYLDGDVERELYQDKRAEILGEKKRLQEQIEQATLGVLTWVEPMKQWIETADSICKIAKSDDLLAKKSLCLEIFGSNLKMQNKNVVVNDDQFLHSPQENSWVLLRKSLEKIAPQGDNFRFSSDLVRMGRVELPSQPWEGHIMAVIRHPHSSLL